MAHLLVVPISPFDELATSVLAADADELVERAYRDGSPCQPT